MATKAQVLDYIVKHAESVQEEYNMAVDKMAEELKVDAIHAIEWQSRNVSALSHQWKHLYWAVEATKHRADVVAEQISNKIESIRDAMLRATPGQSTSPWANAVENEGFGARRRVLEILLSWKRGLDNAE